MGIDDFCRKKFPLRQRVRESSQLARVVRMGLSSEAADAIRKRLLAAVHITLPSHPRKLAARPVRQFLFSRSFTSLIVRGCNSPDHDGPISVVPNGIFSRPVESRSA